jgi:ABC-2 type transport system permease protein
MLPAVPFFFLMLILRKPNGVTAQVLSWIPFTAGQTMMIRLSAAPAGVHWWEILGTLVLMVITTWFCIKIGARFFRVGLLLTGARPKFREVMRQAGLMS